MPDGSSIAPEKPVKTRKRGPKINVLRVAGDWVKALSGYKRDVEKWCKAALGTHTGQIVSVVLADDGFVRDLNHQYRGKDAATNVLSFPGEGEELGDIVLAFETVAREAQQQSKSFEAHAAHLVVHGVLHLLGHDHETDEEAERMEQQEIDILNQFGFTNPYEAP